MFAPKVAAPHLDSTHKRFTPSRDGRLPLLIPDIAAARHKIIGAPTISAALAAHDGLT
jgi:hypothetical protein